MTVKSALCMGYLVLKVALKAVTAETWFRMDFSWAKIIH